MSARLRAIRGPLIATLAMVPILIGLGVWQLYRLQWKLGILAQIAAAEAAPPIPLPGHPTRFEKVFVTGHWLPLAALYGDEVRDTPDGPVEGGELVMPLRRDDGVVVLVDLGFVPWTSPRPVDPGSDTAIGYVHEPVVAGWFSGKADPGRRLFYTLDPHAMGEALGLSRVADFTLIAMGNAPARGWPVPQPFLPRPRNEHLQYALTWFSFAIILIVIFVLHVRKRWAEL